MGETFSARASNLSAWTLRDRATGHWTVNETEITEECLQEEDWILSTRGTLLYILLKC